MLKIVLVSDYLVLVATISANFCISNFVWSSLFEAKDFVCKSTISLNTVLVGCPLVVKIISVAPWCF